MTALLPTFGLADPSKNQNLSLASTEVQTAHRGPTHYQRVGRSLLCSLCSASEETLDHLFILCPYAKAVWTGSLHSWPAICSRFLDFPGDLAGRWRAVRSSFSGRFKYVFDCLFAAVCWEIWTERNRRIFDDIPNSSDKCVFKVINTVQLWSLAFQK